MNSQIGYVVIAYNQASHQPAIPDFSEVHFDKADAEDERNRYTAFSASIGRKETYAIGTIYVEDN